MIGLLYDALRLAGVEEPIVLKRPRIPGRNNSIQFAARALNCSSLPLRILIHTVTWS